MPSLSAVTAVQLFRSAGKYSVYVHKQTHTHTHIHIQIHISFGDASFNLDS